MESAKQIQQLAHRLSERKAELDHDQRSFEREKERWEQSREQGDAILEHRSSQVQQHATQVRIQQRHVMQLQSKIVASYEAAKIAIESIVTAEAVDRDLRDQLNQLKFELGPRFDEIRRQWQHLFRRLENQQLDREMSADI